MLSDLRAFFLLQFLVIFSCPRSEGGRAMAFPVGPTPCALGGGRKRAGAGWTAPVEYHCLVFGGLRGVRSFSSFSCCFSSRTLELHAQTDTWP